MKTFHLIFHRLAWFGLIALTLLACRKEKDELNLTNTNSNNDPAAVFVNARLMGAVVSETGQPVSGATVKLGSHEQTSNSNGMFVFDNVMMNKNGAFVHMSHAGHWQASRKVYPHHNGTHQTQLVLMPKEYAGQINAASGGMVSSNGGFEVSFSEDAIADSEGNIYSGSVEVAARWLNPTADGTVKMMPGDLTGLNDSNEKVAIAHYGIAAVELTAGGQTLNLRVDHPALLKFPIPAELLGGAPNQIGLWRFDELNGVWQQEGHAELNGSHYEASVTHFSFWCIGEEFDTVELTGLITNDNDNPISGIPVNLIHPEFGFLGTVYTAANGVFSGQVPTGESLTLTVANQCNQTILAQEITPLSADTDLGTINITDGESATTLISGSLQNCDGEAVTTGIIYVCWSGGCQSILADNDGGFAQTFVHCGADDFEVLVIDYNSGQTVTFNEDVAGSINTGVVVVCETELDTYISLSFDNSERFYPFPIQFIQSGRPHLKSVDSSYSIKLSFAQPETGVFMNDSVSITYFEYSYTEDNQLFGESGSCSWGECTNLTIDVSEYGEIGGYIEGTYSGTIDMTNSNQEMPGEPISGSFRVIREN